MFLEFCGKLFFSKVRPMSPLFFFLLLSPFFLIGLYFLVQDRALQQSEELFMSLKKRGDLALERKNRKERLIKRYSSVEPFFLDRFIESLVFLQKERSQLKALICHPAVSDKKALEDRLKFLESNQNRLAFIEESIRSSSEMKETEEKQRHPVQMDGDDLQKLCSYIEDMPLGVYEPIAQMPQLIIQGLRIKKLDHSVHSVGYEVEMELLKREWFH